MKKIFYIVVVILLLSITCHARMGILQSCGSSTSVAATCETQASPTDMTAQDSSYQVWYTAGRTYVSAGFLSDGSTICKIEVYVDTSTGTDPSLGTVTAYIYSDDGGTPALPSSNIATFGTLSTTGLGTAGWHSITGSWTGNNGTRYHLVIGSTSLDGTNIPRWYRDNTCTTELIAASTDGATFTNASTSVCLNMRFYKQ